MGRTIRIAMLLGVLALMPLSAGVALAADLAGDYAAQGADADGHSYKGDVRIQSLGSVAQAVLWRLENGEAYKGLGLVTGGVLGVAYGPVDAQFGIVVYRVEGGMLDGVWTLPRYAKEPAGREVLEGSPNLDGDYRIALGENPDGTTNYTGRVKIQRQGDVYLFAWFVPGPNPSAIGIGVRQGDVIAVAYGASLKQLGAVAYRIDADRLDGVWSSGKTRLGQETLVKAP